ncbi:MAG: glycosyltransferase involved in cell wall biosynthesis, partial [Candidatus Marinamargulisbacteria bacterium]
MVTNARKGATDYPVELLLISQLFYPELVSTGQTLTEICEVLSEKGVKIEVLCGHPTLVSQKRVKRKMTYKGITIKRVFSTRFPKIFFWGKLINHITFTVSIFLRLLFAKKNRPIIVLTNPPFLAFVCALAKKIRGLKLVYLIFDVYPETAIKCGLLNESGFIAKTWKACNQFIFANSEKIIVIGRCMQSVIKKQVPANQHHKITYIHMWCDDPAIQKSFQSENPFAKKWGLRKKNTLMYSGNMGRFHDMESIMEAARILQTNEKFEFVFVGEGHKKKAAMTFAKTHGLKNCQFHSYVSRKQLGHLLASADVGLVSLLPSQEGLSVPSKSFGLMAAGTPILGILPEKSEISLIVKAEGCGWIVPPRQPKKLARVISEIFEDPVILKDKGLNGKIAIKKTY